MLRFVSQVNNFFSFCESFSRRPPVVFSRSEERLCSLLLSKSTTFFRFVKLCFTVEPVVFFNREECLCSPLLSKSTTFSVPRNFLFHRGASHFLQSRGAVMLPFASGVNRFFVSAKFHFACVSMNRFPSSRGAFMLHPAPQVNHFFCFRQINFRKQQLFT